LTCNDIVDFGQCMADAFELGCFWLYDSASGTTGECWAKKNKSLACTDAKTQGQCTWGEVDGFAADCFWLYDSASGTTGECWAKKSESLTCAHAKTQGQCTWGEVDGFGASCVWLEGNVIGEVYTEARCMKRVCVRLHLWCYMV
jgi:hypothetical protein